MDGRTRYERPDEWCSVHNREKEDGMCYECIQEKVESIAPEPITPAKLRRVVSTIRRAKSFEEVEGPLRIYLRRHGWGDDAASRFVRAMQEIKRASSS